MKTNTDTQIARLHQYAAKLAADWARIGTIEDDIFAPLAGLTPRKREYTMDDFRSSARELCPIIANLATAIGDAR